MCCCACPSLLQSYLNDMQGLEKYLMTKIYHKVFAVSELDRERDESLTMRMSALGFIEPKHLDIPETYHDEKSWILARKELHKINNYKVRILPGGLEHYHDLCSEPHCCTGDSW